MQGNLFGGKKDNTKKHPERDIAIAARKRQEAEERNAKWASLSAPEQLAALDERFGAGRGATKQRLKLHERQLREAAEKPQKAAAADPIPEMTAAKKKLKAKERRAAEKEGLRPWGGR